MEARYLSSLDLWGADPPTDDWEIVKTQGCLGETCHHVSHDPAAPIVRWGPPGGLVELEVVSDPDGDWGWYYAPDLQRYYRVRQPRHYWARIEEVDAPPARIERALGRWLRHEAG
jgi:hypothetical protein